MVGRLFFFLRIETSIMLHHYKDPNEKKQQYFRKKSLGSAGSDS